MVTLHRIINNVFLTTVFPLILVSVWLLGLIALSTLKLYLAACFLLFVVAPIIFKYSISFQRGLLFLTFIAYPKNVSFAKPDNHGLYATRNLYIKHFDPEENREVQIGLWHVLPNYIAKKFQTQFNLNETIITNLQTTKITKEQENGLTRIESDSKYKTINETNEEEFFEEVLKLPTSSIILYLHGNTASRGAPHRVELYKVLRDMGYHIITIDYRSYGDSQKVPPTEMGVIRDAIAAYTYLTKLTKNPIFLWGHSLGTGVSSHMLAYMAKNNIPGPRSLVLESPFNNINEEIRAHPMAAFYKHLPWFDYTIAKPMYSNNLRFESDQHIGEFRQPVLILHAEDDLVVPFKLGYKLYRSALDIRGKSWGPVQFHRFDSTQHLGHKFICRSPELPQIVNTFFHTYKNEFY